MKCTLNSNIKSISGKCGGILYKTFTRNGKQFTRAYILPYDRETGKYGYKRQAPVTKKEIACRAKFTLVTERLNQLSEDTKKQFAQQWKADKYCFNGKKYCTLRGYIMARLYAETENFNPES